MRLWLSDQSDNDVYVQDYQPQADRTAIDPAVRNFPTSRQLVSKTNKSQTPVSPAGFLTTQLIRILHDNMDLAMPALLLLDLYFCLWDCYIINPAEKIYLTEKQQQIQESNEWLQVENDVLIQRCNVVGLRACASWPSCQGRCSPEGNR